MLCSTIFQRSKPLSFTVLKRRRTEGTIFSKTLLLTLPSSGDFKFMRILVLLWQISVNAKIGSFIAYAHIFYFYLIFNTERFFCSEKKWNRQPSIKSYENVKITAVEINAVHKENTTGVRNAQKLFFRNHDENFKYPGALRSENLVVFDFDSLQKLIKGEITLSESLNL